MRKRLEIGTGIGAMTIVTLFVTMTLTIIGTLALMTANGEYKLTQKAIESTKAYYIADAQAEEKLARIDEKIMIAYDMTIEKLQHTSINQQKLEDSYINAIEEMLLDEVEITIKKESSNEGILSYHVALNNNQQLQVELLLYKFSQVQQEYYQIKSWNIVNTNEWDYQQYEEKFEDMPSVIGGK